MSVRGPFAKFLGPAKKRLVIGVLPRPIEVIGGSRQLGILALGAGGRGRPLPGNDAIEIEC